MGQARPVSRVNRQIKSEAKSFEILLQMIVSRIPAIDLAMSRELLEEQ